MKKLTALVLALSMLLGVSAFAEEALEMSDVPGMTAPGVLPIVTEPRDIDRRHCIQHASYGL